MRNPKIAFQGEIGAYSEQAARSFFQQEIALFPQPTFKKLFQSLASGESEYAVVPIENSLAGSVHENYDFLLEYKLPIVGEIVLHISHNLMAYPGVKKEIIRRVISHPQALGQCRVYLEEWPNLLIEPGYDTAGSAKLVREKKLVDTAAIASKQAAGDYGLEIIAEAIESNHQNYTRFLILAKEAQPPEKGGKTSIVFSTKDIPGALFKSLAVFALRDINLLKIESRPLHGKPFNYYFYLDFEGSLKEEAQKNAINHLKEITAFIQILGSFNKGKTIE
ncbi:MAG: prephenate dehydratase [Calditrichaeota bacterium]|nr:MAG: prephenate dehydratase [Calditrichota bacterium]